MCCESSDNNRGLCRGESWASWNQRHAGFAQLSSTAPKERLLVALMELLGPVSKASVLGVYCGALAWCGRRRVAWCLALLRLPVPVFSTLPMERWRIHSRAFDLKAYCASDNKGLSFELRIFSPMMTERAFDSKSCQLTSGTRTNKQQSTPR